METYKSNDGFCSFEFDQKMTMMKMRLVLPLSVRSPLDTWTCGTREISLICTVSLSLKRGWINAILSRDLIKANALAKGGGAKLFYGSLVYLSPVKSSRVADRYLEL